MTPEQILELLEGIAAKLAPAAKEIWRIYMRQVTAMGYISLFWAVFWTAGTAACIKLMRWSVEKVRSAPDDLDAPVWMALAVFSALGTVGCAAAVVDRLSNAVLHLSNPVYYAIQLLLGH